MLLGDSVALLIRSVQLEDYPTVLNINREGVPGVSLLTVEELSELRSISSYFQVAELKGTSVGYLIALEATAAYDFEEFVWFKTNLQSFFYVDQVAVAAYARRHKVARRLYADLERFALAKDITMLTLKVNLKPPNLTSLAFHSTLGFAEVGQLRTRDGRLVSLNVKYLTRAPSARVPAA